MKILRAMLPLFALVAIGLSSRWLPPRPAVVAVKIDRMDHGRFKKLEVYVPSVTPKNVVMFLSGADGWDAAMAARAQSLAARGMLVVGIDLPQLNADFEADDVSCVYPDGDLENLSHFVQAYYKLPTYAEPILAGYADGATLAYATLAQSPKNTFAAAVSIDFCPTLELRKPLCPGSGIESQPNADKTGVQFQPAKQLQTPWVVLDPALGAACPVAAVQDFVAQVPGGKIDPATGPTAFLGAIEQLTAHGQVAALAAPPAQLSNLPIVAVPVGAGVAAADAFAILLSGDGGWAGLDQEVAAALSSSGIGVVGLDSLRYFWSARTPAGLANDIDRMIRYYRDALGLQRVLLIGYSQGADVLPFAVNRLSPDTRANVALLAIMGMSEHALFEFHMTSWVTDDDSGPATRPEVNRITGTPVVCIYGEGEDDSLCPLLDSNKVDIVKLKGGHHFDGDYASLARAILAARGGARHLPP